MTAEPDPAVRFFRGLLSQDAQASQIRGMLAEALLATGDYEGAIAEASIAISEDDSLVKPLIVRAAAHKALGDYGQACEDLSRVTQLTPDRPKVLVNLAQCLAEIDRLDDAERVLRRSVALAPNLAEAHASLSSILVRLDRSREAEAPSRAALALDAEMISAHQNLAHILADSDPVSARYHREASFGRQQIFVRGSPRARREVLVLSAADHSNVPLRHLLPCAEARLIHWYVEFASEDQGHALPPFDTVFNAIGDADLLPKLPPTVCRFLDTRGPLVLNRPDRVRRTARDNLSALLSGIAGVVVPPVVRVSSGGPDLVRAVAAAGVAPPLLVRPVGGHGGAGVVRIESAEDLLPLPPSPRYVTQFVDTASPAAWYRKYRVIFIEGRPFAYHLAISRRWMVHYWTADMRDCEEHRTEEARFLESPERVLGSRTMDALRIVGERLGLDYAGIDFGRLPNGELVVFEANATMLVQPERDARFGYRNAAFAAIREAFLAMVDRRTELSRPS